MLFVITSVIIEARTNINPCQVRLKWKSSKNWRLVWTWSTWESESHRAAAGWSHPTCAGCHFLRKITYMPQCRHKCTHTHRHTHMHTQQPTDSYTHNNKHQNCIIHTPELSETASQESTALKNSTQSALLTLWWFRWCEETSWGYLSMHRWISPT